MPFSSQSEMENEESAPKAEPFEEFFPDGRLKKSGQKIQDTPVGVWKEWHQSGELASIDRFENGLREGQCESFYQDGSPKARRSFVGGIEHGTRFIWYLDGTTWEEQFENGVKHGLWIERKEGQIVSIRRFKKGEEV